MFHLQVRLRGVTLPQRKSERLICPFRYFRIGRPPDGPGTVALGRCLEKLNFQQILAMIDKRYANHREVFKNPMSTEMIEAVTVTGSPCEGITASKNPTVLWALPGRKTTR